MKIFWWTFCSIAVLSGATWAFITFGEFDFQTEEISKEQKQTMKEVNEPTEQKEIKAVEDEKKLLDEFAFQDELHAMTHQKVEAEKKWGDEQITPKKIDEMLGILMAVKQSDNMEYKHFDFYWEALNKWDKGNFDNAVIVHNRIWNLQNGTIGKATGFLSHEEEEEYIAENF
ncbi:DUF6241 domain-containing protein [Halobacillus ihumii]|uniref:DUF6241 domain-containing protein n=1 Tax=Halobacillus ihumii TaxID=2686092 RepID=UPI0013D71860|nr:DUF6241 domain-containing protein [Halobacillus ihumii]